MKWLTLSDNKWRVSMIGDERKLMTMNENELRWMRMDEMRPFLAFSCFPQMRLYLANTFLILPSNSLPITRILSKKFESPRNWTGLTKESMKRRSNRKRKEKEEEEESWKRGKVLWTWNRDLNACGAEIRVRKQRGGRGGNGLQNCRRVSSTLCQRIVWKWKESINGAARVKGTRKKDI